MNAQPAATLGRLASLSEAAEKYSVSERTVRRWVALGLVRAYRVGPRLLRVDLAEMDADLRRIPTASGAA